MNLVSIPFRDLPLGARFKYKNGSKEVYVLLDRAGSGIVAQLWKVGQNRTMQGIYSAFETAQACLDAEVWAIVDEDGC